MLGQKPERPWGRGCRKPFKVHCLVCSGCVASQVLVPLDAAYKMSYVTTQASCIHFASRLFYPYSVIPLIQINK